MCLAFGAAFAGVCVSGANVFGQGATIEARNLTIEKYQLEGFDPQDVVCNDITSVGQGAVSMYSNMDVYLPRQQELMDASGAVVQVTLPESEFHTAADAGNIYLWAFQGRHVCDAVNQLLPGADTTVELVIVNFDMHLNGSDAVFRKVRNKVRVEIETQPLAPVAGSKIMLRNYDGAFGDFDDPVAGFYGETAQYDRRDLFLFLQSI